MSWTWHPRARDELTNAKRSPGGSVLVGELKASTYSVSLGEGPTIPQVHPRIRLLPVATHEQWTLLYAEQHDGNYIALHLVNREWDKVPRPAFTLAMRRLENNGH
ncbi:hypothetical protein CAE01nite_20460 [Cellulomonas aerilata]|uniref:Uncharacterized protein n=1 Tax=Cellulomonas aerilata TaxID=515326 RepID=A0A512DCX2_9CELL|nr:hypothetical protein CAE01nite_20460 [Cellulomonas aerilata]